MNLRSISRSNRIRVTSLWLLSIGFVTYSVTVSLGQSNREEGKRQPLPDPSSFPKNIFFKDAFKEGLIGTRPEKLGGAKSIPSPVLPVASEEHVSVRWSQFVTRETLEDEVKRLQIATLRTITTPGRFSSGGYKDVRRQFTELAALFAVIGSYDRDVRWKKVAPYARDLFARSAANAKVSSLQAFNEAKARRLDLETLVRGDAIHPSKPIEKKNRWTRICDRSPLMERFTASYDEGLLVWVSDEASFKKKLPAIRHEADLIRLFGTILQREGMEDAEDEDYRNYCVQLTENAEHVLQAAAAQNLGAARDSVARLGRACVDCHSDYRG